MDIQKEMRDTISKNLIFYRKKCGLTQAQLAEKLGYTDKAISKWERGEGVPDVFILKDLANIFGVQVSTLLDEEIKSPKRIVYTKRKSVLFAWAVALVYAIATVLYVTLSMIFPHEHRLYLLFIYAIPLASIVICALNRVWKVPVLSLIFQSILIWTLILSLYLTFHNVLHLLKDYYLFFAGIPLQALITLWYFRNRKERNGVEKNESNSK